MSKIRAAFNKASNSYNHHAVLQQEIATRLDKKLGIIANKPSVVLDLGAGTGLLTQQLSQRFPSSKIIALDFAQDLLKHNQVVDKICADANQLPIADNSVDVVTSNLMLQWCEDLNAVFGECHRVLKNDGILLFSTFGATTLKELKKSWAVVDNYDHVNVFVDMHDIGDQVLANGFQSPVMTMELLTLTYQNVKDLLKELKAVGAQTLNQRSKSLMGKDKFALMMQMYESYRQNGKLPATYEIVYGYALASSHVSFKGTNIYKLGSLPIETYGS